MEQSFPLQEAEALYRAGRLAEARAVCERILAQEPRHFGALYLAGLAALHEGGDASGFFARAVAVDPGNASAVYNLGNALMVLNRHAEAEARYADAIALKPDSAPIHANRGVALAELRRFDEAIASHDRALKLKPGFFEALRNRGVALHAVGRLDDAIASYGEAAAVNPRDVMTFAQRGSALLLARRYEAAADDYSTALALQPDYGLRLRRLFARMSGCIWDGYHAEIEALAAVPAQGLKHADPYPLVALTDAPETQRALAVGHSRERFPENPGLGPLTRRTRTGKIRLGYISPDFHTHPVSHLLVEALENHDRSRFEITAVSLGPHRKDDLRARLRNACDDFLDVHDMSDRDIAARARDLGIDIAVDLGGYTTNCRPGIFAYRAAPVQVNYLGYPGTLGTPFMDYLIADPVLVPQDARAFYTEKIVTLPHCYQPGDRQRAGAEGSAAREVYGLPREGVVFCAFHNSFKITPPMFDCWMNILGAVSGSVLWLRFEGDTPMTNLRREAERRGMDPARLVFARHVPLAEHLARHRLADVFLDAYPYNAHSTANDALWMGLPVMTLAGKSYAARVAASLLTAVGLPELIAHSLAAYQALAIALAGDPARRAALREKLAKARHASPLFDTPAYTRHLEAAYAAMVERSDAGIAPDHIHIAP